jgi:putative photosynthetic complex assembly protein 2
MSQIALPIVFALLVWWAGTGIILFAIGLSRRTYPRSLTIAGGLLVLSLWALAEGRNGNTDWDAYLAFAGALAVWGFVEMTFLMGYVTGSRKTSCPAGSKGWLRARYATETIIYHELALIAAGTAVFVATWNGGNRIATATFAILWIMRLSSKLNLFLGVRTLNDELLPRQLQHLRSYFRRSNMNSLYPVSVIVPAAVMVLFVMRGVAPEATEFETAAFLLLASLLALAVIEHIFMMIPMPIARLWGLEPLDKLPAVNQADFNDAKFGGAKPSPIKPT